MGEAVRGVGRDQVIPVGLCETFAGIGGARRAFDILGCTPAFHIAFETNEEATRVSRCQYPDAFHLGDVKEATRESVAEALRDVPDVRIVFHTSGPPCQDVTGLSAKRKGFSGERSRLADYIPSIDDMLQSSFPGVDNCSLCERVASFDAEDQKNYNKLNRSKPYLICPSQMYAVRRPHLYWINWKIHSQPGVKASKESRWTKLTLTATRKMPMRRWIPKGWRCHVKSPLFPTFVRAIK